MVVPHCKAQAGSDETEAAEADEGLGHGAGPALAGSGAQVQEWKKEAPDAPGYKKVGVFVDSL